MNTSGTTGGSLFNSGRSACPQRTSHVRTSGSRSHNSGFTLIEVLIVVAILGIVATVVILNIASFSARGTVNAANTESHQVQTALIAYMQANNLNTWDGIVGDPGPQDVEQFLLNSQRLQARYTVSGGKIVDALAYPDGKWAECVWDADNHEWQLAD